MLRFEKVEKPTLGELHSTNDVRTTRKLGVLQKKAKTPVNEEVELASMLKDSENEKKENGESTDLPKGELE